METQPQLQPQRASCTYRGEDGAASDTPMHECRYRCGHWGALETITQHEDCCVGRLRHTVMCAPSAPIPAWKEHKHALADSWRQLQHSASPQGQGHAPAKSLLFSALSPAMQELYGQAAPTSAAQQGGEGPAQQQDARQELGNYASVTDVLRTAAEGAKLVSRIKTVEEFKRRRQRAEQIAQNLQQQQQRSQYGPFV